jgi:hypothetical protein
VSTRQKSASRNAARVRVWCVLAAITCVFVVSPAAAFAGTEADEARPSPSVSLVPKAQEPRIVPVLLWWAAQLIPNSDIAVAADHARYGLRWQFTPLSYSWGINSKLSGWRSLVVEPFVRNSGSVELHVSPGMYFEPSPTVLMRTGVRATFPLMHWGEYLSTSVGGFHQWAFGEHRGYAEVGLYTLLGIVGIQVAVDPSWQAEHPVLISVTLRYF